MAGKTPSQTYLKFPNQPAWVSLSVGIVNLSGRGMLVVSVARQLGSEESFARLLYCPRAGPEKGALGPLS